MDEDTRREHDFRVVRSVEIGVSTGNARKCVRCHAIYDKNESIRFCPACIVSLGAEALRERFRSVS